MTCFSEARDDLSQWRAYGGGENGYALAFKAKDIRGIPNSIFARVVYHDDEKHRKFSEKVAFQFVQFIIDGLARYGDDSLNWTANFLHMWDQQITQIAPMIKDPGFDSEREYRLIKSYMLEDLKSLQFIQKSAMMSRHLPIVPSPTGSDPYRLPVQEVMVGPCRYPHVSVVSVATMLQQTGYMTPVTISRSPFQATLLLRVKHEHWERFATSTA